MLRWARSVLWFLGEHCIVYLNLVVPVCADVEPIRSILALAPSHALIRALTDTGTDPDCVTAHIVCYSGSHVDVVFSGLVSSFKPCPPCHINHRGYRHAPVVFPHCIVHSQTPSYDQHPVVVAVATCMPLQPTHKMQGMGISEEVLWFSVSILCCMFVCVHFNSHLCSLDICSVVFCLN